MRRFSRSNSARDRDRNSQNSAHSAQSSTSQPHSSNPQGVAGGQAPAHQTTGPASFTDAPHNAGPGQAVHHREASNPISMNGAPVNDGSRPVSAATNSSFDFMGQRPVSGAQPGDHVPLSRAIASLSRTDQIVLRHFWEEKYADNAKRDLHFLKFPFFPQYPSHKDLMPYCEIYHLVKTSPGASIISLGSANGVYIGFELSQGAQLHIDMDDEWTQISHHRVAFKPYNTVLADPSSESAFKSWPKPLTIEFLEEQYARWLGDLTSFCWHDESVRELGAQAAQPQAPSTGIATSAPGLGEKDDHGQL